MTEWDDNRKLLKSSQEQKSAYYVVSEKQNEHTKLGVSHKHTLHSHVAGVRAHPDLNPAPHLLAGHRKWAHYSLCSYTKGKKSSQCLPHG